MRNLILGAILCLLLTSNAYAGRMYAQYVVASDATTTSFTATTAATVYSHSFPIGSASYFSLRYQAVSAGGTPNINIQAEQSVARPSTEGASNTNWVVGDNVAAVVTGVTTETWHIVEFSPVPAPFARFAINEIGSSTNTQVTLQLIVVED